jgi:hypothetical protein
MSLRTVEMALATPGLDADGTPTRVPVGVGSSSLGTYDEDLGAEGMLVNIGPQHPATHGVLRLVLELEGETVKRCIPHLGYLHSGFEKLGEYRQYNQIIPLTDRTDYLSPMANNVALALAVEKLMGLELTERCRVLRVIACEMSRIISHLVWLGTTGIDLGAFTPFLWSFQEREINPNQHPAPQSLHLPQPPPDPPQRHWPRSRLAPPRPQLRPPPDRRRNDRRPQTNHPPTRRPGPPRPAESKG